MFWFFLKFCICNYVYNFFIKRSIMFFKKDVEKQFDKIANEFENIYSVIYDIKREMDYG